MCLSLPGKIVSINESGLAIVDYSGVMREASTALLPSVNLGDWVIISSKMIMQTVDEEEAKKVLALWDETDKVE